MIKALNNTGFDLIRAGNRSPCSLWCVIGILPPGLAVGVILYPQHSKNKQKFVGAFTLICQTFLASSGPLLTLPRAIFAAAGATSWLT
jgi:hypothetical protein